MTSEELHAILDNEDKKLSIKELCEVIYQLKQDCLDRGNKHLALYEMNIKEDIKDLENYQFYNGEANAFQISLDLLEHLKGE